VWHGPGTAEEGIFRVIQKPACVTVWHWRPKVAQIRQHNNLPTRH